MSNQDNNFVAKVRQFALPVIVIIAIIVSGVLLFSCRAGGGPQLPGAPGGQTDEDMIATQIALGVRETSVAQAEQTLQAAGQAAPAEPTTPAEEPAALPAPTSTSAAQPIESYGELLYEETFDSTPQWDFDRVENGNLIIRPNNDAVPQDFGIYADFIFESQFDYQGSKSMAFYLRHQRPPCPDWNCSIQIALYFDDKTVVARRFLGASTVQEITKSGPVPTLSPYQWNKITVIAKGQTYEVYINDTFVFSFTDETYAEGAFILDNAGPEEIKIDYVRIYGIGQ